MNSTTLSTKRQTGSAVASQRGGRGGYLPGLDGLRALAVIAVLVFHASAAWLPGGFLGVEVFFVISGFIITRGLVQEWQQSGSVNLGSFWRRRALRLLPALFVLLLGVLAYSIVFEPDRVAGLRSDLLAALTYVTNWQLILSDQSYFAAWERPSLLRHLWSLAVEEQFYLTWPLLFALAIRFVARRHFAVLVMAGALASYAAMALIHGAGGDDAASRVYYGTDTRIGALLIGAALALWQPRPAALGATATRALHAAGVASLALLAYLTVYLGDSSALLYKGGFLLTSSATVVLIAAITREESSLGRLLGAAPLRWVGVRSYGIYLWHWPIYMLTWPREPELPLLAAQVAATVAIAALSYRLIENPVRAGALGRLWKMVGQPASDLRVPAARVALLTGAGLTAVMVAGAAAAKPAPLPDYMSETEVRIMSNGPTQGFFIEEWEIEAFEAAAMQAYFERLFPRTAPAETSAEPVQEPETPAEPEPAMQVGPEPEPQAPRQPETPPPPPANRGDCATIRGTQYHSPEEREWFLANCVTAPAPAPARNTSAPAAPAPVASGPVNPGVRVTALGDSVMLGAARQMAATVQGIDVDAAVSRQASAFISLLRQRAASGQLGSIVVIHVGNNGTVSAAQFDEMMSVIGPQRRAVFITAKVPRDWQNANNAVLAQGAARHANASLIDWYGASVGRPELFAGDGIHLQPAGAQLYASLVAGAVR